VSTGPNHSLDPREPRALLNLSNKVSPGRDEKEDCIGQSFVSDHGSVLAIISALNAGDPLKLQLNILSHIAPGVSPDSDTGLVYSWLCSGYTADTDVRIGRDGLGCDIDALRAQASTWKLAVQVWDDTSYPIQYCVSQPVTEYCKL